jgi:hypothetical protein
MPPIPDARKRNDHDDQDTPGRPALLLLVHTPYEDGPPNRDPRDYPITTWASTYQYDPGSRAALGAVVVSVSVPNDTGSRVAAGLLRRLADVLERHGDRLVAEGENRDFRPGEDDPFPTDLPPPAAADSEADTDNGICPYCGFPESPEFGLCFCGDDDDEDFD